MHLPSTPHIRLLFSLCASVSIGVGMLYAPVWWLTILGASLWLYLLLSSATLREALFSGVFFGCCTSGAGLISLLEVFPATDGNVLSTSLVVFLLWSIPTLTLALPAVSMAWVLYLLREKILKYVAFPFLLILNEEAKMWLWTVVSYGKGAILEPHLSISALAYALAETPMTLSIASISGISSLTFFLGVASAFLALCLACTNTKIKETNRMYVAGILCVVMVAMLSFSHIHTTKHTEELGLSVMSVTSYYGTDAFTPITIDTRTDPPDLFLLPEGKTLAMVIQNSEEVETWLASSLIVHSTEGENDTGARTHRVLYERDGEVVASHDKHFIMPYGEYVPFLSQVFINTIPDSNIRSIETENIVTHGTTLSTVDIGSNRIGALLCSEIFSPYLYRKLAKAHDTTVLVNLGDPVWFNSSHLLYQKTKQVAKVHAVQNGAYVLVAQNSAPSFVVTPYGSVLFETEWGKSRATPFTI